MLDVRYAAPQSGSRDSNAGEPESPLQVLCREQQQQRLTALRDRIPAADSPDSAITHALLTKVVALQGARESQPGLDAAGRELWTASKRWPDDLDLAWMSFRTCSPDFGCDRHVALQHLADLDPDNAAVWIWVMHQEEAGSTARDQALHRAATAKLYDTRSGSAFLRLQPVLATTPPPESCLSPEVRLLMSKQLSRPATTADWANMVAMPIEFLNAWMPYGGVAKSCKANTQPAMPAPRRQDCMTLLARISDDGSPMAQLIGLSLQIRLAGDGDGSAQLRERYRRLRWLRGHLQELQLGGHVMDIMRDGEVATWQTVAKEQGLWPPPPDWLPDDPRSRSLILTGKVPPGQH